MEEQFLPFQYKQNLYQQLHQLRQGSKTVDTYTEEFQQLIARNDLLEEEE